jgi:hypothetical protein
VESMQPRGPLEVDRGTVSIFRVVDGTFYRITRRHNAGDNAVRSARCETLEFSKYVTLHEDVQEVLQESHA